MYIKSILIFMWNTLESLRRAMLLRSINHAVALSLKRNPKSPKSQYIRAIILVKGTHFYGFHASYTPFLKILVSDPSFVNRITTILQSGSVMSTRFRVFESHLSYILQFLSDFGLYGCGIMEIEDALERCAQAQEEGEEEQGLSADAAMTVKFLPSSYFRESRLPLEVDVIAPHILNRHLLAARNIHHKLQIPAPALPSEPLVLSVRELWEDERLHRESLGLDPSPEIPLDPSESSRLKGGEWVAEARWWEEIARRIERERVVPHTNATKDTTADWERFVMTTFESIEAVWEKKYKTWKPAKKPVQAGNLETKASRSGQDDIWGGKDPGNAVDLEGDAKVDVDISLLSESDMTQLDQDEQEPDNKQEPAIQDLTKEDEGDTDGEEDRAISEERDLGPDPVEGEIVRDEVQQNPFVDNPESLVAETVGYQLSSPPLAKRELCPDSRENSPTPKRRKVEESGEDHSVTLKETRFEKTPTPTLEATDTVSTNKESQGDDSPHPAKIDVPVSTFPAEYRSTLISARAFQPSRVFDTCITDNANRYVYSLPAPTLAELEYGLQALDLPNKIYQPPYYSKDADVPDVSREFAGLTFRLKGGQGVTCLEDWYTSQKPATKAAFANKKVVLNPRGVGGWEYASVPPTCADVRRSLKVVTQTKDAMTLKYRSQIEGPTQANIYGFKTSPHVTVKPSRERTNMSIMSLEVFVPTTGDKVPDPENDEVHAIFFAYRIAGRDISRSGVMVQRSANALHKKLGEFNPQSFDSELDLINGLIDLVMELDPDILTGWELQMNSWGYLEARGRTLSLTITELISRAPPRYKAASSIDPWASRKASNIMVAGRHVFNLWRVMRSERTLTIYTFENVVFDVLRRRVPRYSFRTLTEWYTSPAVVQTTLLFGHMLMRARTNLELLEETDLVTKTAEFARVFGVDFFSVLSRGSQFKVESFMFRMAKPESFMLISPSRNDVGRQNAAECMPLIMEPQSAFYTSPLLVLDFQSLYPSVMIAYNYCYSTCLGRVTGFKGANKFGVLPHLDVDPALLEKLKDHINVSPNGMMYVKPNVRKGLLARMLIELLDTRVMVKQAMKRVGGDKARKRILDARQLSLKYIANVTYGYTSASFSGRLPAVEIADSIVQSGRETLEKAIETIETTRKWGAKVMYGDTDSVFVYLPGKTKEQAFAVGYDIAETITSMNPAPIKLKFEKVYLPCVLMAKKRYVGFKFESIDEVEPTFDAKGIETVRRDGILAQRKMVENCLKMLFRTQDLSQIKNYCYRSWHKILENKAPVQDFIFAKEVRMGTYSEKGPPPPGVLVAARKMVLDPNDEPQYGDRIPYVIARSATAVRLVDRAMDPLDFMNNGQVHLDANYYITRVLIPPLARIFNLMGADITQWYNEMPKIVAPELVSPRKPKLTNYGRDSPSKQNIDEHFSSTQCLSCGDPATQGLCDGCSKAPRETMANLRSRIRQKEDWLVKTHQVCATCTGSAAADAIHCVSLDCQWFYARRKAEKETELIPIFEDLLEDLEFADNNKERHNEAPIVYELVDSPSPDSSLDIYVDDLIEN
ncbi:hypothetical protein CPB83DRAFT_462528 [Crepidotus variabilis]|uniref:DNA polymerase n=1 Tax=Crepidotus variabilis TaxID=179855 RepID=A0A9P6ECM3_9AGAR|nr:hypothetical protein CPB83DRAFT_462528 [Crepidotus variabilis]